MTFLKHTLLGRFIPSTLLLLLPGCASVIGTYEPVTIHSACGDQVIMAKIDTGARSNSVHLPLADELCLEKTGKIQTVKSASGVTNRPIVEITYTLAGKTISSTANVADRSRLQYPMIVGVRDLDFKDFLIKPERMRDELEAEEE